MNSRPPIRISLRLPARIVALILADVFVVACSSGTGPVFTQWEGDLVPIPPATVGGRAAAVTQFGRTEVSVQINEAEPEVPYGWRIDTGSCQGSGTIQGGDASYPGLTPGPGGTATANAILPVIFPANGAYAVRVFLQGSGKVVSCGDLALTS